MRISMMGLGVSMLSRHILTGAVVLTAFGLASPASADDHEDDGDRPAVHFVGRWEFSDRDGPRANWSSSGVVADFVGTQTSITLRIFETDPLYFMVVVDGGAPTRFAGTNGRARYTLATGLPYGKHSVQVTADTEGQYGTVQFLGFDFGNGSLLPAPHPKLRMEVIGDSISCGYGNIGTSTVEDADNGFSAPVCSFSTATESAYMAYSSVLARMLGAEVSNVCWSGRGVYEDGDGDIDSPRFPQLPTVYRDALAADGTNGVTLHEYPYPSANTTNAPNDIVLVNLGTNDIAATGSLPPKGPLRSAYLNLLSEIRANNPDAQIFLTIGTMTSDPQLTEFRQLLDDVIRVARDPRIHRVDMDVQDVTLGVGCDWHPTWMEDDRMAAQLAGQMQGVLGIRASSSDPNPYTP